MKKLTLSILLPAILLAYQPANPPPVFISTRTKIEPTPVVGIVPAVIIGAAVVGGAGWVGFKLLNRVMRLWENRITNNAPDAVVFTFAEDEYPE